MMSEQIPPIPKGDEPESGDRRDALKAGLRTAIGFFALMKGLDADDAEARGRKNKEKSGSFLESTKTPENALSEYESYLVSVPLSTEHKKQGHEVQVSELMEPRIEGAHEPSQEQLRALLGSQNGLIVIPNFHRALLYVYDKDTNIFSLKKEMPVGTGRHKDSSEGEYFTPRGVFKARWKKELHLSKYSQAFKKMQQLPRRLWDTIKQEAYDMPYTVNVNEDGVATHGSNRFGRNRKGEETLTLDRSHGCINMRNEDARLVHDTLVDVQSERNASAIIILNDVPSVANNDMVNTLQEEFAEDTQEHTGAIRMYAADAPGTNTDMLIKRQPDVADYIAQIRRFGNISLGSAEMMQGVIRAPLHRDPLTKKQIFVSGVKTGARSLLLSKDSALRVFSVPKLLGHEAEAPVTHIAEEMLSAERDGLLHGTLAFVASRGFETGVDAGNDTHINAQPTFLIDPEMSPEIKARAQHALAQKGGREGLIQSINRGEMLVGILRPDQFSAFVDKESIDRGEPVFVHGASIPRLDGSFDGANTKTLFTGLVVDVVPLIDAQGGVMTDADGQWGMVLVSKPSKTKAVTEGLDN